MIDDIRFRKLLDACVEGEETAVKELFEEWVYPQALMILRRLEFDASKHDDLCQEAALRFFRSLRKMRSRELRGAKALLSRIARSVVIDGIRAKGSMDLVDISDLDPSLNSDEVSPEALIEKENLLSEAIKRLRKLHAPCVELLAKIAEGVRMQELAEMLETTDKAVRTRAWDCRKKLRAILAGLESDGSEA